ncbi:PREDICTED: interferon-induced, double-stranded RNA-activated protein kinase-like, partial [Gekko japonicus]|uniref:Interferon-induced, double-stranded RNA-activated protein kinase-like n=1 Tax=Gekko japonicus TaxID=146911 RepID=A0ABM1LFE6_GEKJA
MASSPAVPRNYLANLNEYCQRSRLKLEYKDVSVTGPPHDLTFTVMVVIEKKEYTPATGKSKKEAKSCAAKLAWDAIHQEMEASSPPPQPLQCAALDMTPSVNYISLLNEYALKNKVSVQYPLKNKIGEDHKPNFFCACEIDGKVYGEGTGQNKQKAKLNAAKQAYEKLLTQPVFRPEQSAASINPSLSNSHETSEVTFMNGTDSGLESKGINDKLTTEIDAVQVSPRDPAVKSKRKDTPLAPKFSKLQLREPRESKYTINK